MDHIPARTWPDSRDWANRKSFLRIADTLPDEEVVLITACEEDKAITVALSVDGFAKLITDSIRRLALMRGRQAAVEAVAAAVPETRLRGRTEWELTEKAHDALRPAEGADTSPAGVATPGTGDEVHHEPASHPEPVRLLDVTPTHAAPEQACHDALTEAMTAALYAARKRPRYRGVHTCPCGAWFANYDMQLPGGVWISTFALHYLMFHRSEIPPAELERVARHLGVDLP